MPGHIIPFNANLHLATIVDVVLQYHAMYVCKLIHINNRFLLDLF